MSLDGGELVRRKDNVSIDIEKLKELAERIETAMNGMTEAVKDFGQATEKANNAVREMNRAVHQQTLNNRK